MNESESDRLRAALEQLIADLAPAEDLPAPDLQYADRVRAFGEAIGYGVLMTTAAALWRQKLQAEGGRGGEFVVGPCRSTLTAALRRARAALSEKPEAQ